MEIIFPFCVKFEIVYKAQGFEPLNLLSYNFISIIFEKFIAKTFYI